MRKDGDKRSSCHRGVRDVAESPMLEQMTFYMGNSWSTYGGNGKRKEGERVEARPQAVEDSRVEREGDGETGTSYRRYVLPQSRQ